MAYIYKIINKKNGKMYIGKTNFNIEKRWKEHCSDYIRRKSENRPLYSAINKYGVDMFTIDTIEKVSEEKSSSREKYWIEYYGTFKDGYNATLGGDGGSYIDYDLVVKLYRKYRGQTEVAEIMGISIDSVGYILDARGVNKLTGNEVVIERHSKAVLQLTKDGEPLKVFPSISDAGRALGNLKKSCHIGKVCNGKRKTAYGFKWEFI